MWVASEAGAQRVRTPGGRDGSPVAAGGHATGFVAILEGAAKITVGPEAESALNIITGRSLPFSACAARHAKGEDVAGLPPG